MKISNNQMFRNFNKWCLGMLTAILFVGTFNANAQGEALFKAKCASCHQPHKNGTGPKLFQVRTKWSDGGAKDGSIYQWVKNWQNAVATDPYAQTVSTWSPTAMQAFPELEKADVDAILDWVDSQADPATAAPDAGAEGGTGVVGEDLTEEDSNSWVWVLLGIIFITIIMAVGGVRRQLKIVTEEHTVEKQSYTDEFRSWAWINKKYVMLGSLVIFISLLVSFFFLSFILYFFVLPFFFLSFVFSSNFGRTFTSSKYL